MYPFSLPKTSSYDTCVVTVDLNGGDPVQGSWPDVWTMASTLNTACMYWRNDQPSSVVTGGYIRGGQGNGLILTMGRPGRLSNESSPISEEAK